MPDPQVDVVDGEDGMPEFVVTERAALAPDEEAAFQHDLRNGEGYKQWYDQFALKNGGEPNLDDPDYDYRAAWKAGIRPAPYGHDGGAYHWASSAPDGNMLKSENHPTAWMEHFMRATGKDPNDLGITSKEAGDSYLAGQGQGMPPPNSKNRRAPARQSANMAKPDPSVNMAKPDPSVNIGEAEVSGFTVQGPDGRTYRVEMGEAQPALEPELGDPTAEQIVESYYKSNYDRKPADAVHEREVTQPWEGAVMPPERRSARFQREF